MPQNKELGQSRQNELTLTLFVFWIYTNYHYSSMTSDYATFRTHFFYRWTNFHNRPHLNSIIEFETPHTSKDVEDHIILRANDGDRTREWWSHSPLPYHLATPARHLYMRISNLRDSVYTLSENFLFLAGNVIRTRNVQLGRMALYHWVIPAYLYHIKRYGFV